MADDLWLDAVDQLLSSADFARTTRDFMEHNCGSFVNVKLGEHGLEQNDVHQVCVWRGAEDGVHLHDRGISWGPFSGGSLRQWSVWEGASHCQCTPYLDAKMQLCRPAPGRSSMRNSGTETMV